MRLQIGRNGDFLDLRTGTSVQIDMVSPLYFADNRGAVLPSVKTYSFTVPATRHNELLLGRPAALDNPADFLEQDGWRIYFDGYNLLEGKLEVEDGAYETDIKITFIGGLAGNLDALKTLNLRNIEYPALALGDTPEQAIAFLNQLVLDETADFVFPMVQVDATGEPVDDTDDDTENPIPTKYQWLNFYENDAFVFEGNSRLFSGPNWIKPFRSTIAPQPRLRYVLEQVLAQASYELGGVFDSHPLAAELNRLLLFSNYTLDKQVVDVAQREVRFSDLAIRTEFLPASSMPDLTAADLIRAVVGLLCLAPVLDPVGKRLVLVACKDLLDRPATEDWTAKVTPRYLRGRRLTEIPDGFDYEAPSESYNSNRRRRIPINQVDDYFETLDELNNTYTVADAGKVFYIAEYNEYFETFLGFDDGELGYIEFLRATSLGKDYQPINDTADNIYYPPCAILHQLTETDFEGKYNGLNVDVIEPPGAFVFNRVGLRFAAAYYTDVQSPLQPSDPLDEAVFSMYWGLSKDRDGILSPYCSPNPYDFFGNRIGNMSLLWGGEFGLYNTWWKDWVDALRAMRPVSYPTRLTAQDIANLDWREKVIIDQHEYFRKRIRVTLTTEEIRTAAVEYMQQN